MSRSERKSPLSLCQGIRHAQRRPGSEMTIPEPHCLWRQVGHSLGLTRAAIGPFARGRRRGGQCFFLIELTERNVLYRVYIVTIGLYD